MSGRYRTEDLTKYWSDNRSGYCLAPTCHNIPGTLMHLLLVCPALVATRKRLHEMWLTRSSEFPSLNLFIVQVMQAPLPIQLQFILDPATFPDIISLSQQFGPKIIEQVFYLVRTFAFYIHKQKLIILGRWPGISDKIPCIKSPKFHPVSHINDSTNMILIPGVPADVLPLDNPRGHDVTPICVGKEGHQDLHAIETSRTNNPNQPISSASTALVLSTPAVVPVQALHLSPVGGGVFPGRENSSHNVSIFNHHQGNLVHCSSVACDQGLVICQCRHHLCRSGEKCSCGV